MVITLDHKRDFTNGIETEENFLYFTAGFMFLGLLQWYLWSGKRVWEGSPEVQRRLDKLGKITGAS